MKRTLPLVLLALLFNGVACACPQLIEVENEHAHHQVAAHHGGDDATSADCGGDCECPEFRADSAQTVAALRAEGPGIENDSDDGGATVAERGFPATVRRAEYLSLHATDPGLPQATPVSRFERMLD